MKILVTGGAGFIGSHITEYLVQRGDDVTVLDNLNTGKKENLAKINDKINFVNGDIRDYKLLEELVHDISGVFHEAALASVQDSFNMKDEYFDVNVNGTENIFKLAKEYGFKVVYSSSSSVYGNPKKIPINEDDDRKPINPYAETKLDGEVLAKKYSEMGVRVIGLRYFNVFGPRQSKEYAGVIKLDAIVTIHDPKALDNARKIFHDNIKYANSIPSALKNCQCAVIMIKWKEYEKINNKTIKCMGKKFILDTRRILSNKNLDIKYYGIGLGQKV